MNNLTIGSNALALVAAAAEAEALGFAPLILSSTIHGEAREVAKVLVSIALEAARYGRPVASPACLLSGGETTVTLSGKGKGGRNMELALAAVPELAGALNIALLSAGTDGTDGPTDAAGAVITGASAARAKTLGLSVEAALQAHDSYSFFHKTEELLITGPTRTNVMDLQIMLIVNIHQHPILARSG